ncbi:MAG: efflux RND transporter periplasmic adaptor subunit [Campylobacter sp.]
MNKSVKISIAILVVAGGIWGYFSGFKNDIKAPELVKVWRGNLQNYVVANGEVQARNLTDIGAQVSGQIKKLYVKIGDSVQKGDLIAQIDSVTQENEVKNLQAQLLIDEADLNATQIAANVAKTQFLREQKLFKADATSRESYENAQNTYYLKSATLEQIKAKINQTMIKLDTAKKDLSYTQITAPLSGTIVSVPVKEGQTLNANQTTPTIAQIANLNELEIVMEITEGDITKIKPSQMVEYSILSNPQRKFYAPITTIDPGLTTLSDGKYGNSQNLNSNSSSSSNSAVYYYAKALAENKDNFLKIGMTTENRIIIEQSENVLIVPLNAVIDENGDKFVSVALDGFGAKFEKRAVKVGISDNMNIEILDGLQEGEDIILPEEFLIQNLDQNMKPQVIRF